MKSVVLGTAGHVDHGKTALVQALTGVNTDRWAEERQRGITIDLGFAPLPVDADDLQVSVVDVPGHEDFVKNMLAGASGVDVLLLVVAADEGPMPQTREHLWIAKLLGVQYGVVAISKADLVEAEWCELVAESVSEELVKIFGPVDWPVITVSPVSGQGVDELKDVLSRTARQARARRSDDLFRLPVDRSFSVRGVGTVVTGTVWSGRVAAGDEVRILTEGSRARVRGIQVHDHDVPEATAGQRAALALSGVERSQVGRGQLLVSQPVWRESRYLDVRVQLTGDSPWPLKDWQRVRFHLGTAETLARVVLYQDGPLAPGGSGLAQLRLEQPVVARAGDRFVIRFYSPVTTIGGGIVLDPWATRRSRLDIDEAEALAGRSAGDAAAAALAAVRRRAAGASTDELALLTGYSPAELTDALAALARRSELRPLGDLWYPHQAFAAARDALLTALEGGHARDAGARGVSLESLRSSVGAATLADAVLEDLQNEGLIRVEGSVAALAHHVPTLDPGQRQIATAAAKALQAGALAPPPLKELAIALQVRDDALLAVLKFLAQDGLIVPVTPDLYYDAGAIAEVKNRLRAHLEGGRPASPSELREILGVSRKYLIPLLEHLDSVGFTQRTPDGRVLREP
jgi:selenocysteine-specific elongation factor